MQSFKVTGTPGEAVDLGELSVGDWYTSAADPMPDGSTQIYPNKVGRSDGPRVTTIRRNGSEGWDEADLPVHPLTRHELADGTVEFRHVGAEADKCPACNGTGVKPEPKPERIYLANSDAWAEFQMGSDDEIYIFHKERIHVDRIEEFANGLLGFVAWSRKHASKGGAK